MSDFPLSLEGQPTWVRRWNQGHPAVPTEPIDRARDLVYAAIGNQQQAGRFNDDFATTRVTLQETRESLVKLLAEGESQTPGIRDPLPDGEGDPQLRSEISTAQEALNRTLDGLREAEQNRQERDELQARVDEARERVQEQQKVERGVRTNLYRYQQQADKALEAAFKLLQELKDESEGQALPIESARCAIAIARSSRAYRDCAAAHYELASLGDPGIAETWVPGTTYFVWKRSAAFKAVQTRIKAEAAKVDAALNSQIRPSGILPTIRVELSDLEALLEQAQEALDNGPPEVSDAALAARQHAVESAAQALDTKLRKLEGLLAEITPTTADAAVHQASFAEVTTYSQWGFRFTLITAASLLALSIATALHTGAFSRLLGKIGEQGDSLSDLALRLQTHVDHLGAFTNKLGAASFYTLAATPAAAALTTRLILLWKESAWAEQGAADLFAYRQLQAVEGDGKALSEATFLAWAKRQQMPRPVAAHLNHLFPEQRA